MLRFGSVLVGALVGEPHLKQEVDDNINTANSILQDPLFLAVLNCSHLKIATYQLQDNRPDTYNLNGSLFTSARSFTKAQRSIKYFEYAPHTNHRPETLKTYISI
ncbi:hypothetical protein BPAE_0024g00610 [Botrytis paeoniae]|uniref:Uncharacterized protein n=1 Tax=Botrytis paeoniae TaxID=278948 RepID=A0A4Z1FVJ0_9HELO|nr:hypothetical protein BPAE_0024g00610 [Botrytis paeoniae]